MTIEETARILANSSYFKFVSCIFQYSSQRAIEVLWFHIVTSSICIIALILMEWSRKTRKLLAHRSLILLMDMHAFWTLLLCVTTLVNSAITLHDHLTMT
ncbi:hypothetical protein PRIPAC_78582 [Pristionchus pacificus]|uniref:Uncharacterized protein n=1 Tax=Pristionchus pacificus TaxID=54126 RepID=A0A2A6CPF8_PRIPA|nr:hypothetical protein PRIPAC_78582 [Pristionchus pacificus]|eukprot:PDM80095.1 hypothetical protein PRIPAC_32674 [Pristionchus pacificus]